MYNRENLEVYFMTKKRARNNYLNNKDMLAEVIKSKEQGKMTEKLSHMVVMLTNRYGQHPWFCRYSYLEDMKAFALLTVVRFWDRFDETKSQNAFAYFTQIIKRAFYQYNIQEKKHRNIRDALLVEHGETPSFTYMEEYDADNHHFQKMDNYEKDEQQRNVDRNTSSEEAEPEKTVDKTDDAAKKGPVKKTSAKKEG